jgi:hypothetical protein
VVDTLDQFFVQRVEDLIDFSLTKIEQPLNLIPKTSTGIYSELDDFESQEEGFNSDHSVLKSDNMEDNEDNNEERGNTPPNNQPWLARDVLAIPGRVHLEKLLPKFDPETSRFLEDHIKKFILVIRLMNVQNEDVLCMLFPYTFDNSISTWYFNLHVGSIISWMNFQNDFLDKFAEETTIGSLMAELFFATMGPKEKVKDFNQHFTIILNKFQPEAKPTHDLQIEVYAIALPTSISMFVKRDAKHTLDDNFKKAKTIEFQMRGCKEGQVSLVKKEVQLPPRRGLLLNNVGATSHTPRIFLS